MLRFFLIPCAISWLLLAEAFAQAPRDGETSFAFGGHSKFQLIQLTFPDNSRFRDVLGASATDLNAEARLKWQSRKGRWEFQADYQFIAIDNDTLKLSNRLPGVALPLNNIISDDRRWWDLTYTVEGTGNTAIINRLDRLSVGYSTERSVIRFGRQAISWGNGLLFNPVDVFNPFDPAAVDKEYKAGDDMLYGQHLLGNGHDLQGVAIVRRDPVSGDVEAEQSSFAIKYHGFLGMAEYDLLAAEHYDDPMVAAGASLPVGGAVVRGDLSWTQTETQDVLSAVANISYAWMWGGKNVNGLLEYYYGGFGQKGSDYSPAALLENPDLLVRIGRGELFTLGRQYLGASALIEMTPLFLVTSSFFVNLEDPSMLAQFVFQYDWKQDLVLLASLNLPVGPDGSEYGGIDSTVPGRYLSRGPSLFAQLAWYF